MTVTLRRVYLVTRGPLLVVECVEHGVVWRSGRRKGRAAGARAALHEHERQHEATPCALFAGVVRRYGESGVVGR